jgi:hypothetical protein
MLERPSLLLVAQPDDSIPGVKGEIKVIQNLEERVAVTGLVSIEVTPLPYLRASEAAGLPTSRAMEFWRQESV